MKQKLSQAKPWHIYGLQNTSVQISRRILQEVSACCRTNVHELLAPLLSLVFVWVMANGCFFPQGVSLFIWATITSTINYKFQVVECYFYNTVSRGPLEKGRPYVSVEWWYFYKSGISFESTSVTVWVGWLWGWGGWSGIARTYLAGTLVFLCSPANKMVYTPPERFGKLTGFTKQPDCNFISLPYDSPNW